MPEQFPPPRKPTLNLADVLASDATETTDPADPDYLDKMLKAREDFAHDPPESWGGGKVQGDWASDDDTPDDTPDE